MNPIIECVANVSEGRDARVVDHLTMAIQSVPEVALLDRHVDPDHHRSVLTFAGLPNNVTQAAFELVRTAIPLIDVTTHRGEHPRVGAVDVLPLIPLKGTTVIDCVEWAKQLGARIGSVLHVPVFLYEAACLFSSRRRLEVIRRGGIQGLASRMSSEHLWVPDYGPRHPHPTAGVIVVGARQPLIAFNVVLRTDDLSIAQSIAKIVRTSGGGLPSLKAIGIKLESRGLVQVSMNLTHYHETSIRDAFFAVQQEAETFGVGIEESEVVGLVPQHALSPDWVSTLKIRAWRPDQVLENRLAQAGLM